ncbi:MAG: carboxypeptidase-like regulatory domain-containing protein [Paramuribaculum sp.]|nr:carboxypeptidase-like regulatory domain-containing protein [Paramuribaculum sp.]
MSISAVAQRDAGMISGKVLSPDGEALDYATVFLKGTSFTCSTDEKGLYHIKAPAGSYIIVFSSVGFEKCEMPVTIKPRERSRLSVKLKPVAQLAEVIIVGNQLSKIRNSAFNMKLLQYLLSDNLYRNRSCIYLTSSC